MKNLILFLIFTLATAVVYSQTPFASYNSISQGDVTAQQASAANPWLGAGLSYVFDEDTDFSDNFLLNGRLLYSLTDPASTWQLPIISNVSLSLADGDLFDGETAIKAGLYPYRAFVKEKYTIIAHGALIYGINPDASAETSEQIFKGLAGAELAYYLKYNLPLTISGALSYSSVNTRTNTFGLDATAVLPVAQGLGILTEYFRPFKKADDVLPAYFKAGVVIHTQNN